MPAPMAGDVTRGGTFRCPHCGAEYEVTYMRHELPDTDEARCSVCNEVMAEWHRLLQVPYYRLIGKPGTGVTSG